MLPFSAVVVADSERKIEIFLTKKQKLMEKFDLMGNLWTFARTSQISYSSLPKFEFESAGSSIKCS